MSFSNLLKKFGTAVQKITGAKLDIEWAGASHPGKVRENNEDAFGGFSEVGLWLVCDGLGGGAAGETASRLAVTTIHREFSRNRSLIQAIIAADQQIRQIENSEEPGRHRPGTTVVALAMADGGWQMAWVGDSRGWIFHRHEANQVTCDHTVVQQLLSWGEINEEEARCHPERHKLIQALGLGEKPPLVSHIEGRCRDGMTVLLASDGLAFWDQPEQLAAVLEAGGTAEAAVQRLIDASLAAGGGDNITCIVVRVGKGSQQQGAGR